tara:strand:+ start:300 stop:1022 length:723 start_codon:yes stop_codon:yes gene_type:complete
MFIPSNILKTEKYYDITGTISFIAVISYAYFLNNNSYNLRSSILFYIILIWTLRLGFFLFYRILKSGEDQRFSDLKKRTLSFMVPWTLSAMWVFITSSPALIAIMSKENFDVDIFLILGLALWILGFIIENIADYQKSKFNISNKGQFINIGLWSISRHPNYFGEIILWLGISIIAFPTLSGFQYITLISSIFVYLLLTKVSGINLLEEKSDIKWSKNDTYQNYKDSTPILVPFLGKTKK